MRTRRGSSLARRCLPWSGRCPRCEPRVRGPCIGSLPPAKEYNLQVRLKRTLRQCNFFKLYPVRSFIQSAALGHFQGFVKSFLGSSAGWMAILQLLGSQARRKLREELLKKINRTYRNNLTAAAVDTVNPAVKSDFDKRNARLSEGALRSRVS